MANNISPTYFGRLVRYLNYLKELPEDPGYMISATSIAEALGLNQVLVRKDLAGASDGGRPKVGYVAMELQADLERFLGHDKTFEAVLAGAGNLGKALLSYENFASYGLEIIAAFENLPELTGKKISGKTVHDVKELQKYCRDHGIRIGIIAVPAIAAQEICDSMVLGGVKAIWNFAPTNLKVPEGVAVKNEDMAASLAMLTKQLIDRN